MHIPIRLLLLSWLLAMFATEASALTCIASDIDVTGYEKVLIPRGHGSVRNVSENHSGLYPSFAQNMQFLLFFNEDNSNEGFYVQTQDSAGNLARWSIFTPAASPGTRKLRICTYAASMPAITTDYHLAIDKTRPYIAAAEKYKTWAFQQTWAHRKPSAIDSAKYIALGAYAPHSALEDGLKDLLGTFVESGSSIGNPASATWLTQWRADGFNINYPRYVASTAGNVSFPQLLTWLRDQKKSVALPYINAELWDTSELDPDGDTAHQYSAANMIPDATKPVEYKKCDYPVSGHCLVYACPAISSWRDIILGARNGLLESGTTPLKSPGVYYDMLANAEPVPCSDTSHGHAANDPQSWQASYRNLLSNTDGVVMVEGFGEIYIDLVDVFLMHQESNAAETVPLWNAVYGTISRSAGWYVDAATRSDAAPMMEDVKRAKSFGSWTWGSPWQTEHEADGNALTYQSKLTDTSDTDTSHVRYQDILAMIATPPLLEQSGSDGVVGWGVSGNIRNVSDARYGKNVMELYNPGSGSDPGTAYTTPNWSGTAGYTVARWSMRRKQGAAMYAGFKVLTANHGTVYLYYTDNTVTTALLNTGTGPYYTYRGVGIAPVDYVGSPAQDVGGWQTFERNLQDDLQDFFPSDTIDAVQGFVMFNRPGSVADIKLFKPPKTF